MPDKLIIGCGDLGRRVARAWRERGEAVAALTRSHDNAAMLEAEGIEPVVGDVTRPESLADLPAAGTVLYAVGFDRNAGPSMRDVYVDGLRNVLTALSDTFDRFVYISSTSVYGQHAGEIVDEDSPTEPTRENGQICLEAEQLVRQLPNANILRLAGIYGPGRMLRRMESIRNREPVGGNPEAWLNLIHVEDAVQAVLACEDRGEPGRTYLVADDRPVTRREYYTALANALDADAPEFQGDAATTGLNKRCNNRRLGEDLSVTLRFPTIDEGLPNAVR